MIKSIKLFIKVVTIGLLGICLNLNAANFYIKNGGNNANSGADFNTAWSTVQWSKLSPGDTAYIAGGSYSGFVVSKSGTSGSRIVLKRATKAINSSVVGWSDSFDSQVLVSGTISWNSTGVGSFVTIDGVTDSGIKVSINGGNCVSFDRGANDVILRYLDLAGPGGSSPINMNDDNRNIDATAWNGSNYEAVNNITIEFCRIHGCVNNFWLHTCNGWIIQNNKIYDSAALNSVQWHANICATAGSKNMTWRYNDIYNWQVEGIMFIFGGAANWYIYGNVWHDGMGSNTHRILEAQDGVEGPIYFYNNTCVNISMGIRVANGGTFAAGSSSRNNIFWSAGDNGPIPNSNNIIGNGSANTPFVSYSAKDYRLKAGSSAINAGVNLGSPYNIDFEGKTRGSDGSWDIGAYEYNGIVSTNPVPTPNQLPVVSLSISPNSSTVTNGSSATLTVNTSDSDGIITKVELYNNNSLLNTLTASPYVFNLNNLSLGNYSFTAKSYDNSNGVATSSSINLSVVSSTTNVPPPVVTNSTLNIGDFVSTLSSLRVRSSAGISDLTVLGSQPSNSIGLIIDGPVVVDSYVWWKIDYNNSPDGWSIEKTVDNSSLFLSKYIPPIVNPPCTNNVYVTNTVFVDRFITNIVEKIVTNNITNFVTNKDYSFTISDIISSVTNPNSTNSTINLQIKLNK